MVDALLIRAPAEPATPEVAPVIGHYGMRAVAIYGPDGERLFHAGAKLLRLEEQAAFLGRRGCDEAQGYLFGEPVAAGEFGALWLAQPAAA